MQEFDDLLHRWNEVGYIKEVNGSLLTVDGLPSVKMNEIVLLESGEIAQVFSLQKEKFTILLFSPHSIAIGTRVVRTGEPLKVDVGSFLLGSCIDSLAQPIISSLKPSNSEKRPIDVRPQGIAHRQKITQPFVSGVSIVDMLIPLGKGQRELIIGDRKTGKTSFLLQTVLTQTKTNTVCIYAMIAKQQNEINSLLAYLKDNNISEQTVVVASSRHDPEGLIYLTPYTAMTIAEYFRDQGQDVLVILDDLTTHAKAYRTISLMAKRFPGRSSYPANIFYTHARLLERAGNFKHDGKASAITCLPVAETTNGDLSGYIQTNLMSMTDGHIFFDVNLYASGRRPPINSFLSVSRVGRQTQTPLGQSIAREVNSFLTLLEKSEKYSHFGAEATLNIKDTLSFGSKIIAFFNQPTDVTLPQSLQIFVFALLWARYFQTLSIPEQEAKVEAIRKLYFSNKEIRTFIDEAISNADSLNHLLNALNSQDEKIKKFFSVSQPVITPSNKL